MSEFLENLKKAADEGIFNSEAAKKILEVNELADKKLGKGTPEDFEKLKETLEKRLENTDKTKETKSLTEEEVIEINSEYEKKMKKIKETDVANAQIATLLEIEDMVKASITDMFDFIGTLNVEFKDKLDESRSKYSDEFAKENEAYIELARNIEAIENKYKTIIN